MKGFVSTLLATTALSMMVAGANAQNTAANTAQNPEPKAGEQGPPKTVGAMQGAVGDKATSAEDVRRQSEGKPTMAQESQKGEDATHPGMTEHAPGTVGAAPGTMNPAGEKARK